MTAAIEQFPTARVVASGCAAMLPDGVLIRPLHKHRDPRGDFTELFRDEWELGPQPRQWNIVRSNANVLRGVHAHRTHVDYLTMAAGEMLLALRDLRTKTRTPGMTLLLRLQADDLHLAVIPPGVAHGFYFAEPACHVYAVSETHDGSDEFGCHWADPALELAWRIDAPELSVRDRTAGTYAELVRRFSA